MQNEHVIIVGMALLVLFMLVRSPLGWVAAIVSIILIVGAVKHPEVATSAAVSGTQEEQLHGTMVMVVLILGIPLARWLLKGRGGL